ncbi:MAG: hypothetical protein ACM3H7_02285 [Acidobacteriaceae bacterium]
MKIIQFEPEDRYRRQQFIDLPFRIYQGVSQWVPPLEPDAKLIFDRQKNPFYKHSLASFFLALTDDGSPVARLAVLNNRNYNDFNHERTAFFYLFESYQNPQAVISLFEAACKWAGQQGLDRIIGPKGFSALDGLGLLVRGFEHRPAFGLPYNPPYYAELIEQAGFSATSDIVSGYLSTSMKLPEKFEHISALVQERRGLKIAQFKSKRDLRRIVPKIKDMYNASLSGTSGNVPLTAEEVKAIENQLLWFADPKLIKIILKGDEPVGFLFAYPDISAAIQKTRGRIFPFGWFRLWLEMQRSDWLNINGAGILKQYQGLGGTALLFSEMFKSATSGRFKHAEIVQIGVDNDKMQRELRDLGIDFYKTHRLYQREV